MQTMNTIINSVLILGGISLVLGCIIIIALRKYSFPTDPRQNKIQELLPGSNCGACSFNGCNEYAEAMVMIGAEPGLCCVIDDDTAKKIGGILGREAHLKEKQVACVLCQGENSELKYKYSGTEECLAASIVSGGFRSCENACLGFGDCASACSFSAISWQKGQIPEIIAEKCNACGKCLKVCPVNIIRLIPRSAGIYVKCNVQNKGLTIKKMCTVGCFTCGDCVKTCPEKAITIVNELAKIDYSKCTNCGICVDNCPSGVLLSN